MSKRLIDPKERKALRDKIELLEIVDLEEIKEIILPYIELSYERALDQAASRIAKNIISGIKDDKGVRKFYSCEKSVFVNVDETQNLKALSQVTAQLNIQYKGVGKARAKVRKNMKRALKGQLDIFGEAVI